MADVPMDLSAGDLSQLLVLKSPNGVVVEEGRVYVPLSCPGMLLRLKDAAKHRIRLMVDMKMGAIANNYGVVTLCLAARSLRPSNTSACCHDRRQTPAVQSSHVQCAARHASDCEQRVRGEPDCDFRGSLLALQRHREL